MSSATVVKAPENGTARQNVFARWAPTVVRVLLGLMFFVFGLNGLLKLLPEPEVQLPAGAMAFFTALIASGYMMQLIAVTHLAVGTLLLANRFVPLALALLAPFMVNSIAFHIFLERSGLPMALIITALQLYLVWVYRDAFRPMLAARAAKK